MEDSRPDTPAPPAADPPLTCVHAAQGLCPDCRADYEEDPLAWLEFGDHPEGVERSRRLYAEWAADIAREIADRTVPPAGWSDDDTPFEEPVLGHVCKATPPEDLAVCLDEVADLVAAELLEVLAGRACYSSLQLCLVRVAARIARLKLHLDPTLLPFVEDGDEGPAAG